MKWAIYSKESNQPIWLAENLNDLMRSLVGLNSALGEKFYVDSYPLKEFQSSNQAD